MNTVLWIIQGLLAATFITAGVIITTLHKEKLASKFPWATDFSPGIVRLNGVSKILGGIGLIIPLWTGIIPILTSLAAAGLCLIMVLALIYNARKKDFKSAAVNIIIFLLTALVAYKRI